MITQDKPKGSFWSGMLIAPLIVIPIVMSLFIATKISESSAFYANYLFYSFVLGAVVCFLGAYPLMFAICPVSFNFLLGTQYVLKWWPYVLLANLLNPLNYLTVFEPIIVVCGSACAWCFWFIAIKGCSFKKEVCDA